MSTKLFDYVIESNCLTQQIVACNGELSPEMEDALAKVELGLAHKVDGYKFMMDRLDVESDYWSSQAEVYTKIAKAHKKAKERMKQALKDAMLAMDRKEILGDNVRFSLTPTKASLVINEELLPNQHKIVVTTMVPDKEAIREYLESGEEITGAKLEPSFALRSYANKGNK